MDLARDPVPVLSLLPGLGPHRAEAIVLDRIRYGPARTWEELHRIHGFGPALVETIRRHAALDGGPDASDREVPDRPVR